MVKFLLDTNIVLGIVKGSAECKEILNDIELNECAYSSITRMELLGFPKVTAHEITIISALLNQMKSISIDELIENKTIALKQQYRIKLPDAIILATTLVNELELLTLDKRLTKTFAHIS